MRFLLVALIALLTPCVHHPAQDAALQPPTNPILRIEAAAHSAMIRGVAVDRAGRYLVTAGEDKSARVWELPSLRLLRVLRPPLGNSAREGQLYAVAISPDGQTVAVAGWTGLDWGSEGSIYLFDRSSGKITRRIHGLPNSVDSLAFSQDGLRIAVGFSAGGFCVFAKADGSLEYAEATFGDSIYGLDFDAAGRLAVCCDDGSVRLYGSDGKLIKDVVMPDGGRPRGISFSPDGSKVVVGDERKPDVEVLSGLTLDSQFKAKFNGLSGVAPFVAWSPDGSSISAAGYATDSNGVNVIRTWTVAGSGEPKDVEVATNSVTSLAPIRSGGLAFAAQDGFGILTDTGEVKHGNQPLADPRNIGEDFRVSKDGDGVWFAFKQFGKDPAAFSVTSRAIATNPQDASSHTSGDSPISSLEGLKITSWLDSEHPKVNGIALELEPNERCRSLALLPDAGSFLLGTDGRICCFGVDGALKWGTHTPGTAWAVNATKDGRLAVAALDDGTVRWYRAADGHELLALYAHPDKKRWIVWTLNGYYDCSPGGEDLIGWSVNKGADHEADFYPASQFSGLYYRPDVISKVLGALNETAALSQADAESTRKPQAQTALEILPPVVRIVSEDGQTFDGSTVVVKYTIRTPSGEPVTKLEFQVDGRTVKTESGLNLVAKDEIDRTESVPTPTQDANISVIAYNRFGPSEAQSIGLRYKTATPKPAATADPIAGRPRLIILSIGVGTFTDLHVPQLKYPAKDAEDFLTEVRKQKGKLYRDVQFRLLKDADASRAAILDGLDWIQKQASPNDVSMVFLSGHGENDASGDYYFLPVNVEQDHLRASAISFYEIQKTIRTLKGNLVFFVDTCHSANIIGHGLSGDINGAVNQLAGPENGVVVFTACTGQQYAEENDEWKNGVFTKALIEGLDGQAAMVGNGHVTVSSLDGYVHDRVSTLTHGKQTPTTAKPRAVPDFAIAMTPSGAK